MIANIYEGGIRAKMLLEDLLNDTIVFIWGST